MKALLFLSSILLFSSCAKVDKLFSFGGVRSIKCYSGNVLIYEGKSSGKVYSEQSSDGYIFNEKGSGDLMEVSGNCIMRSL